MKNRHKDCYISIPRGYDEPHDHPCACKCQDGFSFGIEETKTKKRRK